MHINSDDALATVLKLVIGTGAPIVEAVFDEVVNEASCFHFVHQLSLWKHSLFEVSDEVLTQLEAREVVLA